MSMADDRLELLIGRLLDGELSPTQQRALEQELEQDGQARELLKQLQALHECADEVLASEVRDGGTVSEAIFERAWQRNERSFRRRVVKADGHLRFVAGLAAGFLLGLGLHFALARDARPPEVTTISPVADGRSGGTEVVPINQPGRSMQVMRKVDWYGFTDATGNQWLIEGIHEGMARPAAYQGEVY